MTIECALAKLSYLLGKGLQPQEIRDLVGTPLRGDLTPPKPLISDLTGSKDSRIRGLFSRLLLLSSSKSIPQISRTLNHVGGEGFSDSDLSSVEDTLNPLLIASAAAKVDDTLKNLLSALLGKPADTPGAPRPQGLALLNTFTTMSPLHIACLHGIEENVQLLLTHGASVHLRDIQGHTALYYAATSKEASQQQKLSIVKLLIEAGAHLAGAEVELGQRAMSHAEDVQIWQAVGL